jgi:Carboxypeptidase regulatory-like domain/TonB dependent receptor
MSALTPRHEKLAHLKLKRICKFHWLIAALLLFCFSASAQLNYGRIFGVISDQTGGAIIGATVTVTDVQRGVSRALTTDSGGAYSGPNLIPGTYTVHAEFKGFRTVDRRDILVEVGQDIRIDLALQPGEQTQTVTVTGEPPELSTTNAQLGGTLENSTVVELPVNGRQYTQLLNYRPGITGRPGVGPLGFTSNNNRLQDQVWMFDGLFQENIYSGGAPLIGGGGGGAGNDQSTILPLDAIQEMNVIESPKAEYGWKPGAQVNVGLKSGTNRIHGSDYAFGRDTALTATNPFNPVKPNAILEQFGATIGGPLKKDKLFYFGAFEGNRYDVGIARTLQIPGAAAGGGTNQSFPDAIKDLQVHGVALSPLSLALAGCNTAAVCNAASGVFPNPTNNFNVGNNEDTTGGSNNELVKIDYHLNEHNSINGEYYFGDGNYLAGGSLSGNFAMQPYWRQLLHARAQATRAVWVFTPQSNWVNELRFGYDNSTLPNSIGECAQNLGSPNYQAQFGFISGAQFCGFPVITISGGFNSTGDPNSSVVAHWGTVEAADAVSYTRGKHLFKFGFEIHSINWGGGSLINNRGTVNFGTVAAYSVVTPAGTVTSTPLEDFLAGKVSTTAGTLLLGNPLRTLLFKQYAGYVQDDWALTRRLTVNLGLRYEYLKPPVEPDNLIANFNPAVPTGMVQETNSEPVYRSDPNNFGPRVGLAWDLTGKGTTVLRAGGTVVFTSNDLVNQIQTTAGAALPLIPTGFSLYGANGTLLKSPGNIQTGNLALIPSQISWAQNTPIFNSNPSALACSSGVAPSPAGTGPCSIYAMADNFKQGYVTTWTLGVQHAFTNSLSLDVSYVGNHGTKLQGDINANAPTPGAKTGEQQRRPYYSQFPYFGAIEIEAPVAMSNYNALQATLVERISHGLNFTVGYTYAHALDEFSQNGAFFENTPRMDYGNSTYDARHHVTIAAVYKIPGVKSPAQLLQGWELSSTINLLGSFTYNATDQTDDISGTGTNPATANSELDRWTLVGNPKDFNSYAAHAPIPCYGAATSSFGKAGCLTTVPAACTAAAAAESNGPGGSTGTAQLATLGCYMAGNSVIVPPAQGTFGTMGRDVLRTQPYKAWDMALTKNTKIKEWLTAQFRTEIYNVFNSTQFASPNSNLASPLTFGESVATPNSANTLIGSGGPRVFQFALKLIY